MIAGESTPEFAVPAAPEILERVAARLGERNIEAVVVDTGDDARRAVLERIPEGAEVHTAKSKTVEEIGLFTDLNQSGRYDAIRPRYMKMDRRTQAREIARLSSAPDYMVGSVQALTEDGTLVVVSNSGSQIGPYAAGAGKLLLVVGSQKIVPDLAAAMRRVHEWVFPYEDALIRAQFGIPTQVSKVLLIEREPAPGRVTVFLVKEPVGV